MLRIKKCRQPKAEHLPPSAVVSDNVHDARMGRLVGRLFVSGTLLLITFIGYSSQIFVIWPWYGRELSLELLSLLLPFK